MKIILTRIRALLSLLLLGISCTVPNEPSGPDWTVQMNDLPLLRADTLFLSHEVKGGEIVSGEDSVTTLLQTGEASFSLDELFLIDSLTSVLSIVNPGVTATADGQLNLITPELIINSGSFAAGSLSVTYHNLASVVATITLEIRDLTNGNTYFAQVANAVLPNQEVTFSTNLTG